MPLIITLFQHDSLQRRTNKTALEKLLVADVGEELRPSARWPSFSSIGLTLQEAMALQQTCGYPAL